MSETIDFKQIKGIFRRRYQIFLISFFVILVAGGIIAIVWPPSYVSTSVILIENQKIPQEYVQSTITSFVEERLAGITQEVMSRSRLMEIINEFGLYQDMREKYTSEEIIEEMRENIHFEPRTEPVIDRRTGRATEATIYFTLSFEGKDPVKVQKVANVLASLYLQLNLKSREERASSTTEFLKEELERLQGEMDSYEEKISSFKAQHIGELPEYSASNLQALNQLDTQLERLGAQMNSLEERKILLEGQLAVTDPLMPIQTSDGKSMMNPGDRLKYLRMELISMGSRLSKDHPDYIRLKEEIEELEKHSGSAGSYTEAVKRLEALKTELAEAKGQMGDKHPEVVRLKTEIEELSKQIDEGVLSKASEKDGSMMPDNPSYINLMTQINSTDNEISNLEKQKKILEAQVNDYKKMIANAPVIEKEYNKLMLENAMAKQKYTELSSKYNSAEVAQGMERSDSAEKFRIIDPAQLPEKPDSPNRIAILLISLVLALGAGTGVAAVIENLDDSVKSQEALQRLTGVPVLSVINRIDTDDDRHGKRKKKVVWAVAVVLVFIIGAIAFHNLVMPVEVFEAKLERKLNKL